MPATSDAGAAGELGAGLGGAAGTEAVAAGGRPEGESAGAAGLGGEAGSSCQSATTGGRIKIAFDSSNAERVTLLEWTDSTSTLTPNLIGQGGPLYCNDPIEFFGQSYGSPEGTPPGPVVAGGLSTLVQCGLEASVSSAARSCNPAATAQTPVTTKYHFYSDSRASQMRVTRTIGFDLATRIFGDIGLRPFVPRVSLAALPTVIYPNQAGNGVTTLAASSCGDDCITPTGTTWNGKWFADVNTTSGLALIVLRDASLTSAVSLTVNYDAYSSSNLASFVVLQPSSGWKAPLTEIEYLCFADLSSWPQSQRDLAQLPPDCGP